ncbi:MAG: endonuclease/exonuclease/phosphatase family protein [Chloroflexota bacterium]|nr:endonuclease/exonuclease/phosphatase family protein [Chloroflexota bacterium]MDE3103105.1 endonuclease/exonuclease/phosphatase family protein [Chloroflexota bacterium]
MSGALLGGTTFAAVGLLFLLTAIRVFTSTLYQSLFGAVPNDTVGAIALGVFAASILAVVAAWRLGPRGSVALSGTLLAGGTLLATASHSDRAVIVLAAVAVIGGTWWVALVQSARGPSGTSPFVIALPLALVLDLALRAAFRTEMVVELTPAVALLLAAVATLVFLAAGLAWASGERQWTSPGGRGAIALFAIPALLLLSELVGADPGEAAGAGGLDRGPQPAGTWYVVAALLGLGMTTGALLLARRRPPPRFSALILVFAGSLLLWSHLPVAATIGAAIVAVGTFAGASILADTAARPARGPAVGAVALALGWVAFVAIAFVYYAYYAPGAVSFVAVAIVVVGLLAAVPLPTPRFGIPGIVIVGLLGIAVPIGALLTPPSVSRAEPRSAFRLMTYNVHQGFDLGNTPSVERLADVIAAEDPDVVVLEEVVRGWMIDDQHDVLTILSERLGMPYVFGPEIGDAFGDAILSRLPMTDVTVIHFPREPEIKHQPRGAILLTVGGVRLIGTHLDEFDSATEIRQRQVATILAAWHGTRPAIVAGDLNARPGAAELQLLADAGFRDLAKDDGADQPTFPSDHPTERIDYVWGIGVVGSQAHTVASTASDHRAVVINVTRSP